jgi:hypothetical protein
MEGLVPVWANVVECATGLVFKGENGCALRFKGGARSRTRTGTVFPPRDFKSLASTNFAIRAWMNFFKNTLQTTIAEALRASVYHNAIRAWIVS